jgi:hypothetical protein
MSCNVTIFYSLKAARQLMSECYASTLRTLLLKTADGWQNMAANPPLALGDLT